MPDERVPPLVRRGGMIDFIRREQEEFPYLEADFDQDEADETVPTGDAWDMFHSYVEIAAMKTLDLGALLISAVTLRHAFEYLNHDSKFMDLARNGGFMKKARPKVESWLRAECRSRLGAEVDWFEQLREIANFTKHAKLSFETSIFGDEPPVTVIRAGSMTRWVEQRVYQSVWEIANLPSTITRTRLTMSAEGRKPVAIDVEETLYQTRMFFYDVMRAHRPDRLETRPIELVNEGE